MDVTWLTAIGRDAVVASWAQAAIYLATLGVLIRQVNLQRKSLQQSEYFRCQTDFTETYRLLVQSGLHAKVYDELAKGESKFAHWQTYGEADKVTYAYLELLYEIFERVFLLHERAWIPASEWKEWEAWMADVVSNSLFRDVHDDNIGMFDPAFEELVRMRLPAQSRPTTG